MGINGKSLNCLEMGMVAEAGTLRFVSFVSFCSNAFLQKLTNNTKVLKRDFCGRRFEVRVPNDTDCKNH